MKTQAIVFYRAAAWLSAVLAAAPAAAELLQGDWVQPTEERIAEVRKVRVQLLLLNGEGRPVPLAPVRLRMLRHAFSFGVELNPQRFDPKEHPDRLPDQPVWRLLSAVSLDRGSGWPQSQPLPTQWQFGWASAVSQWGQRTATTVRWGGVASANKEALPRWARDLAGLQFADALQRQMEMVFGHFGRMAGDFDLVTDALSHDAISERLGEAGLRHLYEQAKAAAPNATIGVRLENALEPQRLPLAVATINRMTQAFVPVDAVTLEGRFRAPVIQAQLAKELEWVSGLGKPITLAGLEAGGATEGAAAVNLEIVLRSAFACPAVRGIYLHGLEPEDLEDPSAALLDERGKLTACGRVFEELVGGQWWTDVYLRTDELGSARANVFAGWYEVSATYADGKAASMRVYLPAGGPAVRLVALQPLAGESAPPATAPAATSSPGEPADH